MSAGSSEVSKSQTKRCSDGSGEPAQSKCIVHTPGFMQYGPMIMLSKIGDGAARLARLQDIREKRLAQPLESSYRMASICALIPESFNANDGYHRECYQRFTMNLARLSSNVNRATSSSRLARLRSTGDKITFAPDCIFCKSKDRKKVKVKGVWTTQGLSEFESNGWKKVIEAAEKKSDETLLTRIRGKDLFAVEAKYHKSCRVAYTQDSEKWKSDQTDNIERQANLEVAHIQAFAEVKHFLDKDVILNKKMVTLHELTNIYIESLGQTDFPNPNFRGENLKVKIEKEDKYKSIIAFCSLQSRFEKFQTYIVYFADTDMSNAVRSAFKLGYKDRITDTASYLRTVILESFSNAKEWKWPPSAQDLVNLLDVIPVELQRFLELVFTGVQKPNKSKIQRLVTSIGQDICRATTDGRWKLPKHVLLCMSLRHLFRSEKLTTLLNRLGHSENYSFCLELETALAEEVENSSKLLTTKIIPSPDTPFIFHSDFDNFDKLINNLTGKGSIHTAHGIMLQDIEGKTNIASQTSSHTEILPISMHKRSKQRSLNLATPTIPDCYIAHRRNPQLKIKHRTCPGSEGAFNNAEMQHLLWVLIRVKSSTEEQEIPAFTGFVTMSGQTPESLTAIDYYPVIPYAITEYKTVKECLRFAEEATDEVKQHYVVTTFDLGVCMKAYPLIWNNPAEYNRHIVLIGTFHLACSYMKMIGKKMEGSGLSDILHEAGLIASGSLQGVLTGKNYDRAIHCHKILVEALERLLLSQYLHQLGDNEVMSSLPKKSKKILNDLMNFTSPDSLQAAQTDKAIQKYLGDYQIFRERTRTGLLGKTGQLWMSYIDHVWLLLTLIHAVKHNNILLYAYCLENMGSIYFSFGGYNYAKYLTFFSVFIANIEESHPGAMELLKKGAISVARSFIPGNRCAVDKTIEETFMRHAKSHGGAGGIASGTSGILTNYNAYQRWVRTTHTRSQYVHATLSMADMLSGMTDTKHRDIRPTEILKSEKKVQRTIEAIEGFLNPFDVTKDSLLIISSGASASEDICKDVLGAEKAGKDARNAFISSRLEGNEDFFGPVKKLNLKTLAQMRKKSTLPSAKNKFMQYEQQANVAFQLFIKSQKKGIQLNLRELLQYPLTPVPYSISTADGFLTKTEKSKTFTHLTKGIQDAPAPPIESTLVIIDGNAYFHYLKELPNNFSQICTKVFDMMPKAGDVIFGTDNYNVNSPKTMERLRRGSGAKLILKGENTRRPSDWKSFLSNDENKQQFIELLVRVWSKDSYAAKLHGRRVIVTCQTSAYLLTSVDGRNTTRTELSSLSSTQEETDSRVVLYCHYAQKEKYNHVRIKSPDSDVFVILLHYASQITDLIILFDTGTGNNKRLIDVTEVARGYTSQHCTAFLALHAYSGCDTTSAFKGLGKLKPFKILSRMPKFVDVLARLGNEWHVCNNLIDALDEFTCALYGKSRSRSVNELRFNILNELCAKNEDFIIQSRKVDMSLLPPCRYSLEQHIRRVNYQVGIWKRAHISKPDIPDATNGQGWRLVNGLIEPLWYEGSELPQLLIDVACESEETETDDNNSDLDIFDESESCVTSESEDDDE